MAKYIKPLPFTVDIFLILIVIMLMFGSIGTEVPSCEVIDKIVAGALGLYIVTLLIITLIKNKNVKSKKK